MDSFTPSDICACIIVDVHVEKQKLDWGFFLQHADDNMRVVDARLAPWQRRVGRWLLPRSLRVLRVEEPHDLLRWHWYSAQVSSRHGDTVSRRKKASVIVILQGFVMYFKVLLSPRKNQSNITNMSSKCSHGEFEAACDVKQLSYFNLSQFY